MLVVVILPTLNNYILTHHCNSAHKHHFGQMGWREVPFHKLVESLKKNTNDLHTSIIVFRSTIRPESGAENAI